MGFSASGDCFNKDDSTIAILVADSAAGVDLDEIASLYKDCPKKTIGGKEGC